MSGQPQWVDKLRNGENLTLKEQLALIARLSIPAILAELTSIAMQYIDAAMVGSLGANATGSIGLVSSSTWLLGGLCIGASTGFSVQVAHAVGAGDHKAAKGIARQALLFTISFGLIIAAIAVGIHRALPVWLGGEPEILETSSLYFLVFALALPMVQISHTSGSLLQCSGNMKTPSILNASMCVLDVIFNFLLIFPTRTVMIGDFSCVIPGAGMGVMGAALGTVLAEILVGTLMFYHAFIKSPLLQLERKAGWKPDWLCIKKAIKISLPVSMEHVVMCGAHIATTVIVAPLGTVAVAANSLAVTAESFCYMPGYGIGSAATTLVGQSIGAGRKELAFRFGKLSTAIGMIFMTMTGVMMYLGASWMFTLLTPDPAIRELGARVLRLEAFAEPLYAASIVAAGALRGAGDTLIPSIMSLVSMWGIRIPISASLAPAYGLFGVWIAMCVELCARGIIFLIRLLRGKWLELNMGNN